MTTENCNKTEKKCRWCGISTEVDAHIKKVICKHCFKSIAECYTASKNMLDGEEPNNLIA